MNYKNIKEITVKSQDELNNIPLDFKGQIYIAFGTQLVPAVVKYKYYLPVIIQNCYSVIAKNNSTVIAKNNSSVSAYDNSSIKSYNNSSTVASRESSVEAYDNSKIHAFGSSKVTAYNNSVVVANDKSEITLYESSRCLALGNSKITVYDLSEVTAYDTRVSIAWYKTKNENSTVTNNDKFNKTERGNIMNNEELSRDMINVAKQFGEGLEKILASLESVCKVQKAQEEKTPSKNVTTNCPENYKVKKNQEAKSFHIRIDIPLYKKLKKQAYISSKSITETIRMILSEALED